MNATQSDLVFTANLQLAAALLDEFAGAVPPEAAKVAAKTAQDLRKHSLLAPFTTNPPMPYPFTHSNS